MVILKFFVRLPEIDQWISFLNNFFAKWCDLSPEYSDCHAQPCVNIERVMYNQTPNMQIGLNVFKNLFSAFIPYRECTSCISDIDIVNHPGPELDR